MVIDGVEANAFGGGSDFAHLPVANIERIEVVRGAQSACTDRTPSAQWFASSRARAARLPRPRRLRGVGTIPSARRLTTSGSIKGVALGRVDRAADDRQLQRPREQQLAPLFFSTSSSETRRPQTAARAMRKAWALPGRIILLVPTSVEYRVRLERIRAARMAASTRSREGQRALAAGAVGRRAGRALVAHLCEPGDRPSQLDIDSRARSVIPTPAHGARPGGRGPSGGCAAGS